MCWRIILILGALIALAQPRAHAQGINPIPLIIQAESSGNPTAKNLGSTASGLAGDLNGTWAAALTACGGQCGTVAQYPTAADAPASVQVAANNALINSQGLQPWTCVTAAGPCDAKFLAQVTAAGGPSAFQTSGLDTNPADFASLDTSAGLASFLSGGTPLSTGGLGAGTVGAGSLSGSGGVGTLGGGGGLTLGGGAAAPTSGVLDQIVQAFSDATNSWQGALYTIALDLFGILALIDLALSLIYLVLSGGQPNLFDVVATIFRWLLPVGLFIWLMQNGSTFAADIINSMRQAGTAIGGSAITPSGILSSGINLVSQVWNMTHGYFDFGALVAEMLALIFIMGAFALTAVWYAATLIESFFIIGASALFLAFGGFRWSRNIAVGLVLYCLAVGFKLFAMEAIVAVTASFIASWVAAAGNMTFQALFVMIGVSVFLAALAKVVPDKMQQIIVSHPLSVAHYHEVQRQAIGGAALAAAPILAAGGFTALAIQAFREASEKLAGSDQQSQGALGRAGQMAFGAGQSIVGAAGSEISGRLGGLYRGGIGASAARMTSRIAQSRRVGAAERSRPQPPSGT